MADRADWEQATRHQRQLAVAADAELRRRHPDQPWPPLRSAEPQPAQTETIKDTRQDIEDLTGRHREFTRQLADRQSVMIPAVDPDFEALGQAFPTWSAPRKDAILQPPMPYIQPADQILERAADRETDLEPDR
jgi:hypothetical protein